MKELEFVVQWHVTNKCNLNCSHCYESKTSYTELSTKESLFFIDQLIDTLVMWNQGGPISGALHLTGGEPLLRNDIFEISHYAVTNGLTVRLLSNGTLISPVVVKKLVQAGVSSVQVSIDGAPFKHDQIRGIKNSFTMATAGICELIKGGVHTTLSCTLSKYNLNEVPEIIKLAIDLKVNGIKFSRLVATGKGKNLAGLLLSRQETKDLFAYLYKMHFELKDRLTIFLQDPLFCLYEHDTNNNSIEIQQSIAVGGCSIGFSGICLLPDGTFLPCRRLPIPIGNLHKDIFRNLWVNSDLLNSIRDTKNLKGKCNSCDFEKACKGCRAIAYASTGDYQSTDPQCWHESGR